MKAGPIRRNLARLPLLCIPVLIDGLCLSVLPARGAAVSGLSVRQTAASVKMVQADAMEASKNSKGARLISGFESIAADYDAFILDQFGVMHNGVEALPGATECYSKLVAAGKKLVILSNTSRRAGNAQGKLPAMGFDPAALSGFVSSGEEAYKHIQQHLQGKTCLFFTWEREASEPGASFLEGLDVTAAPAATADFILCQGTEIISTGVSSPFETTNFIHSADLSKYVC
jgi:hypothetical protein